MGYSKKVWTQAEQVLRDRRFQAQREAENRKAAIFKAVPEAEALDREIVNSAVRASRAVIMGGDAKAELEKLRDENLAAQRRLRDVLDAHGFAYEALEPEYFCPKCEDTGYYEEESRTVVCDCLKKALINAECDELNRNSPLRLSTFKDFDLGYYSMDIPEGRPRSPYDQMLKNYNVCKKYAAEFGRGTTTNIFMTGKTGLGKTHLSLAIANEVIRKGFGVIYVSAPNLVSALERETFSREPVEERTEDALMECDLLIVDDLGTEFQSSFSSSAIYNLFNSRLLLRKPVIFNSNLDLKELETRYSQRFVSRIAGEAIRLFFYGTDLRAVK